MARFGTQLSLLRLLAILAAGAAIACRANAAPSNPTPADVAAEISRQAQAHRIPEVLLDGLAWRESHWQQFDPSGKTVEPDPHHVGLMGVWDGGRKDADRLRSDWRYNIAEGALQLEKCWFAAPILGDGHLEDSRDILESWYWAIGRYGDGAENAASNRFADSVLDAVANGGEGRWNGVAVSRFASGDALPARNVICPPVPWHFGGVAPRPPATPVVSLKIPYLSQVYDTPDNFNGGGACGPTSMMMVLAYYGKVQPQPLLVSDGYKHTTEYGGLVPALQDKVCTPGMGAVHAKMLDYFRPMFPGVAIFYNEKATRERVKAELDAGRPVIIGTEVTNAGHIMVVRGYLSDGRFLVNDPAGDYYQVGRVHGPDSPLSLTTRRYCNGDGSKAIYDWNAIAVRWVMTFGPKSAKTAGDKAEDATK